MRCYAICSLQPSSVRRPLLFLFALGLLISTASAQQVTLPQVPRAVQNGSAQLVGPFNPQQMLRLVIVLKAPHMEEEEEFVRELQDPASPQFHHFLSQEEFSERFAPTVQDEQAVVNWAQAQGLTVTQRYSSRILVDVEAPVAVIEKALDVSLNSYQMGEKQYFSNDRDPSIPATIADVVQAVFGLNSFEVVRPFSNLEDQSEKPIYSTGPPCTVGTQIQGDGYSLSTSGRGAGSHGPSPYEFFGAYDPTDIYNSNFYNYQPLISLGHCCNPLNNPGGSPPASSIAISIAGNFNDSDIRAFAQQFGLAYNVQRWNVDGTPTANEPETALDIEWSTATANSFGPSAKTAAVYVYMTPNWYFGSMLDTIACASNNGGVARVLNMSWGAPELAGGFGIDEIRAYHTVLHSLASTGWTLSVSAGDQGATADCATTSLNYPASDPDATAVGGTTIHSSQSGYGYEYGWTGGPEGCSQNDGGGGGGCSAYFAAPGYQGSPVCRSNNQTYRSTPDIALNSDGLNTPQVLFYNGSWYSVGGTSVAAPEISGFVAQENAYLLYLGGLIGNTCGSNANAPCAPLGTLTPYLYNQGINHTAPHNPFYDIVQGCNNNDITRQNPQLTYYCAGAGYDRVTGWGSANMFQLAWMVNYALAGDNAGPTAAFTGPATGQWYNTDQTINWTLTDVSSNGHRPVGVAGSSEAWDADPGDPRSEPTPGNGNNYYGLQTYGAAGSANGLSGLSQGCHNAYVRAWDNAGNSRLGSYGPLCFDNIPPVTLILPSGNGGGGQYQGPVLVTLPATDNASGVAATYYNLDNAGYQRYSAPFNVYVPGNHCLWAYSVDVAGNQENPGVNCFNITSNVHYTLTIAKTGTGTGTVTSADGGINCGTTCSASYWDGQPVTLTAAPGSDSLFIGWRNCDLSFGFSCTVTVTEAQSVTAVFNIPVAYQFVPLPPCRVVDTRLANGPYGGPTIAGGNSRDFMIPGGPCPNIPSNAAAYSLNITTVPHGYLGFLTAWPSGFTRPQTSTMNSFDGRIKANGAILPAGDNSSVSVYVSNTADAVIDIDGYFIPTTTSTLQFFPLTPCRVVDTRNANGPLGGPSLAANQSRDFPILQTSCIPHNVTPTAYSFNVTAVPTNGQPLSYLTVWPSGISKPVVSTLNALTGAITANAAIVPAGTGGDINVFPAGTSTDLVIDINGYFAPAASGGLSLYTFNPCRVLDTRQSIGAFTGQIVVNVAGSPCEVPNTAQAYNFNATVLPVGSLGYLTLWPDGQTRPGVSTLNALDGAVTSNMAIVPANTNDGSIDAFAAGTTQLLLDISSYFGP